ncbi:RfbD dTDP-4-dehydrorhamnose reductase [Candidatus Nanopelagicaceae bacterium]
MGKIVVLGSRGMLGREVTRVLQSHQFDVVPTIRGGNVSGSQVRLDFNSNVEELRNFFLKIGRVDYVINCIGMIKQKFNSESEIRDSITVNSMLPAFLNVCSTEFDFRVIQIATDCVFSGREGRYVESSTHDVSDLYGVTKSLGEITSERFLNLRCSIIGEETGTHFSLYSWLLSQPFNSVVNGYTDHYWNGLTTESFSRIVSGILTTESFEPGTKHVVPVDTLTKHNLLGIIAKLNNRSDIIIREYESGTKVDRSLSTEYEEFNNNLWSSAGYESKPTIQNMIEQFVQTSKGAHVG